MLVFKSWAIGFLVSSLVTIAVFGFHRPFGVLTEYLEVPLLPGMLISRTIPVNGPPVGMIILVIFAIPPLISGFLVYGLIVYIILRLRIELRRGNGL